MQSDKGGEGPSSSSFADRSDGDGTVTQTNRSELTTTDDCRLRQRYLRTSLNAGRRARGTDEGILMHSVSPQVAGFFEQPDSTTTALKIPSKKRRESRSRTFTVAPATIPFESSRHNQRSILATNQWAVVSVCESIRASSSHTPLCQKPARHGNLPRTPSYFTDTEYRCWIPARDLSRKRSPSINEGSILIVGQLIQADLFSGDRSSSGKGALDLSFASAMSVTSSRSSCSAEALILSI